MTSGHALHLPISKIHSHTPRKKKKSLCVHHLDLKSQTEWHRQHVIDVVLTQGAHSRRHSANKTIKLALCRKEKKIKPSGRQSPLQYTPMLTRGWQPNTRVCTVQMGNIMICMAAQMKKPLPQSENQFSEFCRILFQMAVEVMGGAKTPCCVSSTVLTPKHTDSLSMQLRNLITTARGKLCLPTVHLACILEHPRRPYP